jgi:YidC/Oxa1 family membrane protein insertase
VDYLADIRRKKLKIYAVALLIILSLFVFAACNNQAQVNADGTVTEPDNPIAKFLDILNKSIGNFGWTVVVFTVILKTALLPLDFWQKNVMRKNAKAMERMKPKLEKLQKQYGHNREEFSRRQLLLYKEEKYSMLGACLPTILTMAIFILIFTGFNKMVNFQNANRYAELKTVYDAEVKPEYDAAYQAKLDEIGDTAYNAAKDAGATDEYAEGMRQEAIAASDNIIIAQQAGRAAADKPEVVARGQAAVAAAYEPEGWLWIKNVFIADAWNESIPKYETFSGTGMGKLGVQGVVREDYEKVMGGLIGTSGWAKNGKWNGWLLLPLLSIALSFLTQKLTQGQQPEMPVDPANPAAGGAMNANMKMMQYLMPVIFGVFAVLYSSAFTIYLFTSSLYSVLFQLVYNAVAKVLDKKEEERRLATTFK